MGPPPGGCGTQDRREYDSIFTSFTISNGEQTIDILANPGATIDADINTGYTTSFTLHAQSTGLVYTPQGYQRVTYTDSVEGVVWLSTNISRLFTQGGCEDGMAREGEKTLTYTHSYEDVGIHYDLPDTQSINFETAQSSANYNIRWVDSANSVGTSELIVNSEDISGNPIYGYYTVLSSGGTVLDTGFTSATFHLDNGVQYEVKVQDYGDYVFDHWKATGSSFRDQGFRITSDTTMTAVYRNINEPAPQQPDFLLYVHSSLVDLPAEDGASTNWIIEIDSIQDFGSDVSLGISPDIEGLTATFDPQVVPVPRGGEATSNLVLTSSSSVAPGTYELTVTGTSGALSDSETKSLTVTSGDEPQAGEPKVTIRSIDANSNDEISGYYTMLFDNSGNAIQTGFTPATFDLTSGQQYIVEVQDYGSYYFNYWQDNDDTDRDRTFTATDSAQTLTAVYSTSPSASPPSEPPADEEEEQPPEQTTGTISVTTTDSSGNQIYGYYTTLSEDGNVIQTAFSPAEFTVNGGQMYQVAVADYRQYTFDHWSDGSYDRFHDAQEGNSLTAVYRN